MILKDKHIFIVEDNTQNRVIFQMALIRHGANVTFERWGRNVVEVLRRTSKVDIIILDLMLADHISGFRIFEQIRELPEFAHIPIVAVSAMDAAEAMPIAKQRGFAGFISKPVDSIVFPQQIARLIAGEHIWFAGERRIV